MELKSIKRSKLIDIYILKQRNKRKKELIMASIFYWIKVIPKNAFLIKKIESSMKNSKMQQNFNSQPARAVETSPSMASAPEIEHIVDP